MKFVFNHKNLKFWKQFFRINTFKSVTKLIAIASRSIEQTKSQKYVYCLIRFSADSSSLNSIIGIKFSRNPMKPIISNTWRLVFSLTLALLLFRNAIGFSTMNKEPIPLGLWVVETLPTTDPIHWVRDRQYRGSIPRN